MGRKGKLHSLIPSRSRMASPMLGQSPIRRVRPVLKRGGGTRFWSGLLNVSPPSSPISLNPSGACPTKTERWMWRPRVFTKEIKFVPFMLTVSVVRAVESRSRDHESSDSMADQDQHLERATTMSKTEARAWASRETSSASSRQ